MKINIDIFEKCGKIKLSKNEAIYKRSRRNFTMEFILDTVNLEEIKDGVDHMPIV